MANPAIHAAIAAAAASKEKATKELFGQLRAAGATSARKAHQLEASDREDRALLDYYLKSDVIRDAGGGRYWLDEERLAAQKATGVRAVLILLAFLLSAAASAWAIAAS